ncbi:MAG: phosphatase PAP2 family protein [Acidimicrobiales bacterium]
MSRWTDLRPWLRAARLRLAGMVAWGMALGAYVAIAGVPYTTDDVLLWLFAALAAFSLGDLRRSGPRLIRDWLPLLGVLVVYNLLRGYASTSPWAPHDSFQLAADRLLGGGVTLTHRLQGWLWDPNHPHWWDDAALIVYLSHFVTSFVIAAVLWRRDHPRFCRYMTMYLLLTFAGFVTFVFYPANPPWLAGYEGHMAAVGRLVPQIFDGLHLHLAAAIFLKGSSFVNNVAAMPSLHGAYPFLILLTFWRGAGRPLRVLLVAYPLAMAFVLVYGGEHFVVDVVAGWIYATVAWAAGNGIFDWWEHRQRRPVSVPVLGDQDRRRVLELTG